MSGNSAIEWTDATWNPVTGCTKVSPGCDHCYAERLTERFGGKGSFATVRLHPERLELPLHWRKPHRVFVNSEAGGADGARGLARAGDDPPPRPEGCRVHS